jgi:hypothetical protein
MFSNKVEKNFNDKKKDMENIVNLDSLKKYNINYIKYDDKSDINNIVELSDPNNSDNSKKILATYKIAGYYNLVSSIWIWAWINPFLEKNMSEKIKDYIQNKNLSKEIKSDKKKELYNYFITEDTLFITGENIDEIIKFILFVSNGSWIISKKQENSNNLEIIILDKIIQNK